MNAAMLREMRDAPFPSSQLIIDQTDILNSTSSFTTPNTTATDSSLNTRINLDSHLEPHAWNAGLLKEGLDNMMLSLREARVKDDVTVNTNSGAPLHSDSKVYSSLSFQATSLFNGKFTTSSQLCLSHTRTISFLSFTSRIIDGRSTSNIYFFFIRGIGVSRPHDQQDVEASKD